VWFKIGFSLCLHPRKPRAAIAEIENSGAGGIGVAATMEIKLM
jgi:hypothetical protein